MKRSLRICKYAFEIVAKGNHLRWIKNGNQSTISSERPLLRKMLGAEGVSGTSI